MCAEDGDSPGGAGNQVLHPVIIYVILAVLGAIGLTLAVWMLRIGIYSYDAWRRKLLLRVQKNDRRESNMTELTVINSPKGGPDNGDHCDGSETKQSNGHHVNGSGGSAASSPRARTSSDKGGASIRERRNFGSYRDGRPCLFLDLSKCKIPGNNGKESNECDIVNEKAGIVETEY
jgi:hypothetical protein